MVTNKSQTNPNMFSPKKHVWSYLWIRIVRVSGALWLSQSIKLSWACVFDVLDF